MYIKVSLRDHVWSGARNGLKRVTDLIIDPNCNKRSGRGEQECPKNGIGFMADKEVAGEP
jgi:hypothetical protein